MSKNRLDISGLQIAVEGKVVLNDFSLQIEAGEVAALIGANGSGKSSLAHALMGDSRYQILDSSIVQFGGVDLLQMSVEERAKAGLFLAWQTPVSIPGMSVFSLCKASYEAHGKKIAKLTEFKAKLEMLAKRVGLSKEYIARSVNEGFSGGERKRLELLQLLLLQPKLAILDEIDSGLDLNGVKILIQIVQEMSERGTSFLIISHNSKLIEKLGIKKTWKTIN